MDPIAIIGMGCRFPHGADNPQAFWSLLQNGIDAVTEVPSNRWSLDEYYDMDMDAKGKIYSRQLKVWGERNEIPVVAQDTGADAASVIYDAYESARAKNIDILIADTAGRLHTQGNLMQELEKIKRVLKKHNENAPHETMLVIDGGSGQNAINQAKEFNKTIGLSGICITKLDGTAKGGVVFAISDELKLPVRYIGVGEGINDLKPFNAKKFVDALFE
jgi:fused signal recognition particle receptor